MFKIDSKIKHKYNLENILYKMNDDIQKIFNILCENNLWSIYNKSLEHCRLCDLYMNINQRYNHIRSIKHGKKYNEYFNDKIQTKILQSPPEIIYTKEMCNICFDEITYGAINKCCKSKYFHIECIMKWKKVNNSCPMCRDEYPLFKNIIYQSINYNNLKLFQLKKIADDRKINIMISNKKCNGMKFMPKKDIIKLLEQN